MELRQLEYFLTVAEELHFGRAAARLHISQPPLTVHIKRLEQELGVLLFDRTSRRVSLTAEGARFREQIKPILQSLEQAVDDIKEVKAGRRGMVRVGFVSSASYQLIPAAVRDTRLKYPGIQVELHPLATGEQLEALLENRLDVGIIRDAPMESGLNFIPLLTEHMVAVLPAAHRLASKQEVSPEDLVGVPLILFPFQSMPGYVNNTLQMFHEIGKQPHVVQRAVNQENVMGLVSAGVGASILPESFSAFQVPGVVNRPITVRPVTRLVLATRHDRENATSDEFIRIIERVAVEVEKKNSAA